MVGAQKGALQSAVFIFSLFFMVLHDDLSPAFAPKALREKEAAHRGGFFCVWSLVAVKRGSEGHRLCVLRYLELYFFPSYRFVRHSPA